MTATSIAATQRMVSPGAEIQSSPTTLSSREVLHATPVHDETALVPSWLPGVLARIYELSELPENWDSYGANPLKDEAASALFNLLDQLKSYIQSQPSVSVTGQGGLLAEWTSPQSAIELSADPGFPISVYYRDEITNREWEGPASQCDPLEKWLWRASSGV